MESMCGGTERRSPTRTGSPESLTTTEARRTVSMCTWALSSGTTFPARHRPMAMCAGPPQVGNPHTTVYQYTLILPSLTTQPAKVYNPTRQPGNLQLHLHSNPSAKTHHHSRSVHRENKTVKIFIFKHIWNIMPN